MMKNSPGIRALGCRSVGCGAYIGGVAGEVDGEVQVQRADVAF
jgi:hypothetical protein